MSEHTVKLRGGHAALDANADVVYGRGWHFFGDEGEHIATLPYADWSREQLQRALDTIQEQWDRGYDTRARMQVA